MKTPAIWASETKSSLSSVKHFPSAAQRIAVQLRPPRVPPSIEPAAAARQPLTGGRRPSDAERKPLTGGRQLQPLVGRRRRFICGLSRRSTNAHVAQSRGCEPSDHSDL